MLSQECEESHCASFSSSGSVVNKVSSLTRGVEEKGKELDSEENKVKEKELDDMQGVQTVAADKVNSSRLSQEQHEPWGQDVFDAVMDCFVADLEAFYST